MNNRSQSDYYVTVNGKKRVARIQTFINPRNLPSDYSLGDFDFHNPSYHIVWNRQINRWLVYKEVETLRMVTLGYKEFLGHWVHIMIVDDGKLNARPPGQWMVSKIQAAEIRGRGMKETQKILVDDLDKPSEYEKRQAGEYWELMADIYKTLMFLKVRPWIKPEKRGKKIYFVNTRKRKT